MTDTNNTTQENTNPVAAGAAEREDDEEQQQQQQQVVRDREQAQAPLPNMSRTDSSSSSSKNEFHAITLDEDDVQRHDDKMKKQVVPESTNHQHSKKQLKDTNSGTSSNRNNTLSKDHIAMMISQAARDSRMVGLEQEQDASDQLNEIMLYRALCAAGAWAYGVLAAEVWIFDNEEGVLRRPKGGFWRDTVLEGDSTALLRLEDPTHPDYVEPKPLAAGEGLPGALWAEADVPILSKLKKKKRFFFGSSSQRHLMDHGNNHDSSFESSPSGEEDDDDEDPFQFRKVVWRNIQALAADPDQPPNDTLKVLAQTGLELAAGVSFYVRGTKGIVIYMTRSSANPTKLQHPDNESYLISAADSIGAEAALGDSRALAIRNRIRDRRETLERARRKIKMAMYLYNQKKLHGEHVEIPPYNMDGDNYQGDSSSNLVGGDDFNVDAEMKASMMTYLKLKAYETSDKVTTFVGKQLSKATGSPSDVNPPPRAPVQQWMVAFFGSIVTLMAIGRLNTWLQLVSDKELLIIMGPIAAQTALQYGLTAAPSAQPRCAIYGQILSITIAMILTYIPSLGTFTPWMRPAIASSLAITVMVALGMCHPPGAATAYAFAAGKNTWAHLGLLLMAYAINITMGVIINNWFDQRQYPIYWKWTYGTPIHYYSQRFKQKLFFGTPDKKDEEEEGEKDIEKGTKA